MDAMLTWVHMHRHGSWKDCKGLTVADISTSEGEVMWLGKGTSAWPDFLHEQNISIVLRNKLSAAFLMCVKLSLCVLTCILLMSLPTLQSLEKNLLAADHPCSWPVRSVPVWAPCSQVPTPPLQGQQAGVRVMASLSGLA